jgi:molybdopterin molybdotransferase
MTTELPHERVPVDDARSRVIASVRLLDTESVALKDLAGRTVGQAVTAPHNLPAHANSAMDGYAVLAGTAGPLTISAQVLAGDDPAPLVAGTAAAIATGGVLPAGADAIVPIERVEVVDELVTATAPIASGDFVRHVGADVQAGDVVLHPGTRLSPLATSAVAGLAIGSSVR